MKFSRLCQIINILSAATKDLFAKMRKKKEVEEPVVEETKSIRKDWPEEFVIPKLVYEEDIKPLSLDELTAVFTGVFNPTSFLQWLAQLPIPEDSVRIKVEVTRK